MSNTSCVSDNFNPVYAISWLASEIESAFITSVSPTSAQQFREARVQEFATFCAIPKRANRPFGRCSIDLLRKYSTGSPPDLRAWRRSNSRASSNVRV